ncbi:MAG TPA: aromatic acid exporter family protein [Pseudonocardia sp.]
MRRFVAELLRRCRERGRTALLRALRVTGATVAAFVVAEGVGIQSPPPLVAALTALLVVQATLASTLVSGVQRVLSVVLGVAVAVRFVSVTGLNWWSLGIVVAASIVAGQILRLGPQLLEVPISAMLVLGVGYTSGAESAGLSRIVETLIGAAVGVLVNVGFPPAVQTRSAGQEVAKFAGGIANLLVEAASAMATGPVEAHDAARWLDDARRLNRHAPQLDRALAEADESRRLNVRALGTPRVGRSLREGLEALEHSSVSMRLLFRTVLDVVRDRPAVESDPAYVEQVRLTAAALLSELAAVVRTFGDLLRDEIEEPGSPDETELATALAALRRRREEIEPLLLDDPRSRAGLWELNFGLITVTDRMLRELDVTEHARLRAELTDAARARRRAEAALERLRDTTVGRFTDHDHDH